MAVLICSVLSNRLTTELAGLLAGREHVQNEKANSALHHVRDCEPNVVEASVCRGSGMALAQTFSSVYPEDWRRPRMRMIQFQRAAGWY